MVDPDTVGAESDEGSMDEILHGLRLITIL